MASGDTKTENYLDIAAHGTRSNLPKDNCCNTKTQNYILDVAERIMDVEDEVEELKNNPDVVDIVDTYADLEAYDTQHLTDNDIIRVLNDETHNGESTYYRFTKNPDTWTYIGSTGPHGGGSDGKAKILSAADYNYPTDNPNSVALWLLDPGMYYAPQGVSARMHNLISSSGFFVVGFSGNKGACYISKYEDGYIELYRCQTSNGNGSNQGALWAPIDDLTTASSAMPLSANQGKVLKDLVDGLVKSNAGAPTTSTTGTVGQLLEDTTNGKLYICTDATNPYVWEEVGAGGGGGDTVYSSIQTSNSDTGGAVYIGNLNSSQQEQHEPSNIDHHYKYFCALPATNNFDPGDSSVGILGKASGNSSISFGGSSSATANNSIAMGYGSYAGSNDAIAIGRSSSVSQTNSVALGYRSSATRAGEVNVGTGLNLGFNSTNYRVIGGVHDGQGLHDAATVAQGNTLATSAPTTSTEGVLGQLYTDTTNMHTYQLTAIDVTDPSNPSYSWTQRW